MWCHEQGLWNLHFLCRYHHRARQVVFTVLRDPDGSTAWITRGRWRCTRPRNRYRSPSQAAPVQNPDRRTRRARQIGTSAYPDVELMGHGVDSGVGDLVQTKIDKQSCERPYKRQRLRVLLRRG